MTNNRFTNKNDEITLINKNKISVIIPTFPEVKFSQSPQTYCPLLR